MIHKNVKKKIFFIFYIAKKYLYIQKYIVYFFYLNNNGKNILRNYGELLNYV